MTQQTSTAIPAIERASAALLADALRWTRDERIRSYITAVIGNPEYSELPELSLIRHSTVEGEDGTDEAKIHFLQSRQEAALVLAGDVAMFRMNDRGIGETEIRGIGGPLAVAISDLASSVAIYVSQVEEAWATWMYDQGM